MQQLIKKIFFFLIFTSNFLSNTHCQVWEITSYPDEAGFQQRTADVLKRIATEEFGLRSKAYSECPDTGLPVYTWALEGETIISPYTGTAYTQGPTGYFGPKARNDAGEIIAFGGDPLKYDLPPATACLLLKPDDANTRAFLSIPGNLKQQYHFAAKNWARFYPLLAGVMGNQWQQDFQNAVAEYRESRRPSDGDREHNWLSRPHDLVGEPGQLLGGNKLDGGTENHKTMWRTTALVYAQHFPTTAKISGYPIAEVKEKVAVMIKDYLQRMLKVGNGEYDSQIYYPHSIEAFLNLYDFSDDPEIKEMAKFALDYYLATYSLKTIDGTIAGAQKRGYLNEDSPGEMEALTWAYFKHISREMKQAEISIHQATTSYRPNQVIFNLATNQAPVPFCAQIARPYYHMDQPNQFQETFYRSKSFGLGSVAMTVVDNPTQQVVWSLVATGTEGPLNFGGGQPRYLKPVGHSPYTQTLQHDNCLLVVTGQTGRIDTAQGDLQEKHRLKYASALLKKLKKPENSEQLKSFMAEAPEMAATWLFVPAEVRVESKGKHILMKANQTFIRIQTFGGIPFWLEPPPGWLDKLQPKDPLLIFSNYKILVVPGDFTGYVLEAFEANRYDSWDDFIIKMKDAGSVSVDQRQKKVRYKTVDGHQIEMIYQHQKLRAEGIIDGTEVDYDNWADNGVYDSPLLKIKNGILEITDGKNSYHVDYRQSRPLYSE